MSHGIQQIPALIEGLLKKDYQRIEHRVGELVEANKALGGSPDGYLYFGEFWSNLPIKQRKAADKRILHPSLQPEGKRIYDDRKMLVAEHKRLNQGLHMLLRDCHTAQDTRDALPDLATAILPGLSDIPRTRPEGWPFKGKALHQHTHDRIVEIFGFYAANQILY